MITKFLSYFFILILFLSLPDRFWEKASHLGQSFFDKLRNFLSRHTGLIEKWPLIGEIRRGEKLLNFIPILEARISLGQKKLAVELPRFKFYTTLIFDLLEVHRKLGVSLKQILPEMRINLMKELRFERKLLSQAFGGNLQFSVVTLTTWCFVFLSSQLAELPLNFSILLLIGCIQFLAFLVFNFSFLKLRNHSLHKFSQALEELYLFNGMVEVGRPLNHVLSESGILYGQLFKHKQFLAFSERLHNLVNRWKESGLSPRIEVQEIIQEVWHEKERQYERFLKHLDLLKFCVLAFFFLPAYFFYLYSIFQFFMEQ